MAVDSGSYTPATMKMRQRMAEAMMQQGMQSGPISSHWQGLSRLANALFGGMAMNKLATDEKTANEAAGKAMSDLYFGPSASAPTQDAIKDGAKPKPAPTASSGDYMDFVRQQEGFNPNAYGDYKQTSIGYGTRAKPGETTITREEGERRLTEEVGNARSLVRNWAQQNGVQLSPKREDALTDLTYNAGGDWMGSGLGQSVKAGDWGGAEKRFMQYINAGGKPLPGLLARRAAAAPWLRDGTMPAPSEAALAASEGLPPQALPQQGAPSAPQPQQMAQAPAQTATDAGLDQRIRAAMQHPDPRVRAAGQQLAGALVQRQMQPTEYGFQVVDGQLVRTNKRTGTADVVPGAGGGGGPKLPTGHEWIDPNDRSKGVRKLKGMEETIPGEVAGKIALMSDARKRIADTRGTFEREWGTGDLAKWAAANVPGLGDVPFLSGDVGIAQRDIRTGIEAALRTMTGAAAPEPEVVRYTQMFMPGPNDTKESTKQKINGLVKFMENAEKLVMQGRGQLQLGDAGKMLEEAAGVKSDGGWKDMGGGVRIREKK